MVEHAAPPPESPPTAVASTEGGPASGEHGASARERAARLVKAHALIAALLGSMLADNALPTTARGWEIAARLLDSRDEEFWCQIADLAGVKPPSAATTAEVVAFFRRVGGVR